MQREGDAALWENTEEELEDLLEIFDYDTPLWGVKKTGDELPLYPFAAAGVGALAVLALLLIRTRREKGGAAQK